MKKNKVLGFSVVCCRCKKEQTHYDWRYKTPEDVEAGRKAEGWIENPDGYICCVCVDTANSQQALDLRLLCEQRAS